MTGADVVDDGGVVVAVDTVALGGGADVVDSVAPHDVRAPSNRKDNVTVVIVEFERSVSAGSWMVTSLEVRPRFAAPERFVQGRTTLEIRKCRAMARAGVSIVTYQRCRIQTFGSTYTA